ERRRDRRDQEEEHHDHAVHGEELVVGLCLEEVARRREQLEAQHDGEEAAHEEGARQRDQVEEPDPLVVGGEEPRAHAVALGQVVEPGLLDDDGGCGGHGALASVACRDFTYAISSSTPSSLTRPWYVGMMFS